MGTIEFWFKTEFDVVNGQYQGANNVQKWWLHQYDSLSTGYFYVFFDSTVDDKLDIAFYGGAGNARTKPVVSWGSNELHHFAIVYDRNAGFDGTKTVAIYLDGTEVASNTSDWGSYNNGTGPFIVGNAIVVTGALRNSLTVFDNIKVRNYAKTDFSDRFTE